MGSHRRHSASRGARLARAEQAATIAELRVTVAELLAPHAAFAQVVGTIVLAIAPNQPRLFGDRALNPTATEVTTP